MPLPHEKQWSLHAVHVDVHFKREGKEGSMARVPTFDGDLDEEQRVRLANIRAPVTLMLKQGVAITVAS